MCLFKKRRGRYTLIKYFIGAKASGSPTKLIALYCSAARYRSIVNFSLTGKMIKTIRARRSRGDRASSAKAIMVSSSSNGIMEASMSSETIARNKKGFKHFHDFLRLKYPEKNFDFSNGKAIFQGKVCLNYVEL